MSTIHLGDKIKDRIYIEFEKRLNPNIILILSEQLNYYRIKENITHKHYIQIMEELFPERNNIFSNLFELIFNRFKIIKCWMIGNKESFYITKLTKEDIVNIYNLTCGLTIYMKCEYKEKIRVLFKLTDIDDDGLINKNELIKLISTVNYIFSEEESPIHTGSSVLTQSITTLKIKEAKNLLFLTPGNLKEKFEKDSYIDFSTFYSSLIKIKGYKFKIIPCFINMKTSLNTQKKEKTLTVKKRNKEDFLNVTSEIIHHIDPRIKKNKFSLSMTNIFSKDKKKELEMHKNYGTINLFKTPKISIRLKRRNSIDLTNCCSNFKKLPLLLKKNNYEKYKLNINFEKIQNIEAKPHIIEFEERKNDIFYGNNFNNIIFYNKDYNKSRRESKTSVYKSFNQTIKEINCELGRTSFGEEINEKDMIKLEKQIKIDGIKMKNYFKKNNQINQDSINYNFYKYKRLRKNKSM